MPVRGSGSEGSARSVRLDQQVRAVSPRGRRALVAGVIRNGEQVWGAWSTDESTPDASTLFEIGSVTKVFTGVLLADMHLRGEISLHDPLSRHLPGPQPAWRYSEPTLLELATHRSGLPNSPGPMQRRELAFVLGIRRTDPWAGLTEETYRHLVADESPRRAQRNRPAYSSLAVGLLGDALAARAGTTYEQLLTDRVLAPLGMDSTAVTVRPDWGSRLLGGYSRHGRPRPPLEDLMPAAGSLRSTVMDMLRFLGACLHPPATPPGPALNLAQQPHARLGKQLQIGLCWFVLTRPGRPQVVWHNGGTWGFRSFAGLAPSRGSAAVVLSNTTRSVDRLGLRLLEGKPPRR